MFTKENTITLCEITLNNLVQEGDLDEQDFLDRADLLCGMGQNVMISNFKEYYRLANYFSQFKINELRLITSSLTLANIIDEKFYTHLKGGILEAFATLFQNNVRLYIYPAENSSCSDLITLENIEISQNIKSLFKHLVDNNKLIPIENANREKLHMFSHIVLQKIKDQEPDWEEMLPVYIAEQIKTKQLFGYNPRKSAPRKLKCHDITTT